jgi:hypothetical protein
MPSNPIKGEVSFEAGDQKYTLVLGSYALAALERRQGMPAQKFFDRPADAFGFDDMLGIFHSGLLQHHDLSEREAAVIIDQVGALRTGELIAEAVSLAFPEAANATKGPQKRARAGTG